MVINLDLTMKLVDIVAAYEYGNLDSNIYMKVPEGIPISNQDRASGSKHCSSQAVIVWTLKSSLECGIIA